MQEGYEVAEGDAVGEAGGVDEVELGAGHGGVRGGGAEREVGEGEAGLVGAGVTGVFAQEAVEGGPDIAAGSGLEEEAFEAEGEEGGLVVEGGEEGFEGFVGPGPQEADGEIGGEEGCGGRGEEFPGAGEGLLPSGER